MMAPFMKRRQGVDGVVFVEGRMHLPCEVIELSATLEQERSSLASFGRFGGLVMTKALLEDSRIPENQ